MLFLILFVYYCVLVTGRCVNNILLDGQQYAVHVEQYTVRILFKVTLSRSINSVLLVFEQYVVVLKQYTVRVTC